MDRRDARHKRMVLLRPPTAPACPPGVEPGSGDPVEPAHQRDFVLGPVCFDERKDFRL
jgi:hypothetical protein